MKSKRRYLGEDHHYLSRPPITVLVIQIRRTQTLHLSPDLSQIRRHKNDACYLSVTVAGIECLCFSFLYKLFRRKRCGGSGASLQTGIIGFAVEDAPLSAALAYLHR